MNKTSITGPMRILANWRKRRNRDLPLIRIPEVRMDDDDVDFHSDMIHMRLLLDDLIASKPNPRRVLTDLSLPTLDVALENASLHSFIALAKSVTA